MIGLLAGVLLMVPVCMAGDWSWWLLAAGGAMGLVFEAALRGAGRGGSDKAGGGF